MAEQKQHKKNIRGSLRLFNLNFHSKFWSEYIEDEHYTQNR